MPWEDASRLLTGRKDRHGVSGCCVPDGQRQKSMFTSRVVFERADRQAIVSGGVILYRVEAGADRSCTSPEPLSREADRLHITLLAHLVVRRKGQTTTPMMLYSSTGSQQQAHTVARDSILEGRDTRLIVGVLSLCGRTETDRSC